MQSRVAKVPGPDHPISIRPTPGRVVVRAGGRVIAQTTRALTLREAAYPPVQYIPREDVEMSLLARSAHATYCPYKGDCAYYDIPGAGEKGRNAVWTYELPYHAVEDIRGLLAFYPERVDAIELQGLD